MEPTAPRGHRPRLELVPAGRLHLGSRRHVVEAHRRDLRAGAHRRGAGRAGRAAARADGARAGDVELVRALLPRHGDRRGPRGGDLRDPRGDQPGRVPAQARERPGSRSRCSRGEEEARYGYLAAVNSTTLADGVALDIGGGSLQLTRVARPARARRALVAAGRGADDRALPARRAGQAKQVKALRAHVRASCASAALARGTGGAGSPARRHGAQPRRGRAARGRPAVVGVQGFVSRATRSTS